MKKLWYKLWWACTRAIIVICGKMAKLATGWMFKLDPKLFNVKQPEKPIVKLKQFAIDPVNLSSDMLELPTVKVATNFKTMNYVDRYVNDQKLCDIINTDIVNYAETPQLDDKTTTIQTMLEAGEPLENAETYNSGTLYKDIESKQNKIVKSIMKQCGMFDGEYKSGTVQNQKVHDKIYAATNLMRKTGFGDGISNADIEDLSNLLDKMVPHSKDIAQYIEELNKQLKDAGLSELTETTLDYHNKKFEPLYKIGDDGINQNPEKEQWNVMDSKVDNTLRQEQVVLPSTLELKSNSSITLSAPEIVVTEKKKPSKRRSGPTKSRPSNSRPKPKTSKAAKSKRK